MLAKNDKKEKKQIKKQMAKGKKEWLEKQKKQQEYLQSLYNNK